MSSRTRPWIRSAIGGAALAGALAGVIAFANWRVVEAATEIADDAADGTRDVAIVPGCAAIDGRPQPMLAARLNAALTLYRSNRVRKILVSGNGAAAEPTAMRRWLVERRVPPRDILSDDLGTRTIESMNNAVTTFHVRTAFVCTQPMFLPRALFLARAAGIEAHGASAQCNPGSHLQPRVKEIVKRSLAYAETFVRGAPATSSATTLALR